MACETRPRHLSPRTSETAAWETPAAWATSRLVGRVLAGATAGLLLIVGSFAVVFVRSSSVVLARGFGRLDR
ncbi:hypothetical protein GCM10014715_17310 [Streptomyces spiralis]|uniref:Uncharacterized protein n=1 Tax=Streptomyces spiralis TaxID=66376 RepID=A0A918ZRW6_9ACTN|nr:hypothetical protein GCM10014715_17310 [Streptomyces spiralis]